MGKLSVGPVHRLARACAMACTRAMQQRGKGLWGPGHMGIGLGMGPSISFASRTLACCHLTRSYTLDAGSGDAGSGDAGSGDAGSGDAGSGDDV